MGEQYVGLGTWRLRGSCTGGEDNDGEDDSKLHAAWGEGTGYTIISWQAGGVPTSLAEGVP